MSSQQETNFVEIVAINTWAARVGLGLSQEQLAERASVSRATIVAIEAAETDPQLSTLISIAAALDLSLAALMIDMKSVNTIHEVGGLFEKIQNLDKLFESARAQFEQLRYSDIPRNRRKAVQMVVEAIKDKVPARTLPFLAIMFYNDC